MRAETDLVFVRANGGTIFSSSSNQQLQTGHFQLSSSQGQYFFIVKLFAT
jgi:hypothetical protein